MSLINWLFLKSNWFCEDLFFFYKHAGVGALDFQYTSIGPGPCVHVTLDAILTLNLNNAQNTQTLSLTGAKVTSGMCKADKTELTVSTAQSHTVHFLFTKTADGTVSISYKVVYKREGKGRCVTRLPIYTSFIRLSKRQKQVKRYQCSDCWNVCTGHQTNEVPTFGQ